MIRRSILSTVSIGLLSLAGCDKIPYLNSGSTNVTGNTTAVELASVSAAETPGDLQQDRDQNTKQRIGRLLENVLPTLEEARTLVDQHAELPDSSAIPFRTDKQSNSAAINELLDEAIVALSISEVSDYRQQIREANDAIVNSQEKIADYRRQRLSASWAKDQSQIEKVNPFELSKEAIDEQIKTEQQSIENQQEHLKQLKVTFAGELSKIGVEVDEAGVESLLSSVSGDDIVSMAVVFDNIKQLTTQLQELTEQSGEALETSKRYYGMYVVLVHVMDRIQKTFIRDINADYIPKLEGFSVQAGKNIKQAQTLIKADGGDAETLKGNIESNELTRRTAKLYIEFLKQNAEQIAVENKRAQKNLATAMNTYDTVKLSSDVAKLMSTGRRDFEALMKLKVPSLREFNNDEIRKEFQRMTTELRMQ
ncbi:hypothetical protein [Rhodopirellula sp. MGV]|uniref:hypothetical protein n=1 Tax=Rhodopirellula sp. MGV TaxID=2023130 RepID=UPI000B95E8E4|nr:hypothetical protein [Rhodopirellula sp. MGV]OYP38868.1 hypothetical protein CGZ80_01220 [Rhodopirellula sp. MGV]PNY37679.1 hypothetical protein C2E31_06955 [Rhodopirellula baltica]